jgi:hypothetical protein
MFLLAYLIWLKQRKYLQYTIIVTMVERRRKLGYNELYVIGLWTMLRLIIDVGDAPCESQGVCVCVFVHVN